MTNDGDTLLPYFAWTDTKSEWKADSLTAEGSRNSLMRSKAERRVSTSHRRQPMQSGVAKSPPYGTLRGLKV